VLTSLSLIIVVYALLAVATILILRMLARRWRRSDLREATVPDGAAARPQEQAATRAGARWPR
jgi:hypothetical protein